MSKELILKKVEQIKQLLDELGIFLAKSHEDFLKDTVVIRASERDFQLIVELASDINTHILLEKGKKTPDSYKQSFTDLIAEGVLSAELADQ
ncbi:MAG: hypothetical protein UU22_C0044G0008 [Parcubacteria group bacterium GW2011_GWA2_40_8]|nr:MAG: hypothetical protein UU22_C0044G0008 [Parcubacteria group bacterium GW2011_GWA2_40_8]